MNQVFKQLVGRGVARVAVAYVALSWLLLQVIDVLTSMLDLPAWIGRVSVISLAIGFPLALVLAWTYRLTSEGRLEREVDRPAQTVTKFGGRKIDFVIIGALSLVVITLFVEGGLRDGQSRRDVQSDRPFVTAYKKLSHSQVTLPPMTSPLPLVVDESRLYFITFPDGDYGLSQLAQSGGEAVPFNFPYDKSDSVALPIAITPDKSEILFAVLEGLKSGDFASELWTLPTVGGSPRRLGEGRQGVFSPSGNQLLFMKGSLEMYLANVDMTEPRKIATLQNRVYWPRFSPDGSRVRFTEIIDYYIRTLWELKLDGSDPERLLADWPAKSSCCGSWTPDGEFYVFQARRDGRTQLWAIKNSEDGGIESSEPFPITSGVIDFLRPTISSDGKTIFAIGWQLRGEILEYDSETRAFKPIHGLESMSVEQAEYSRDKQWVTYVSYPDGALWRKNVDGRSPMRLTFEPMLAAGPTWSPDGSMVAFTGWEPGDIHKIYTVSTNGGSLTLISDSDTYSWSPSWSADGNKLVFSEADDERLKVHDITLGTVVDLPGSDGINSPTWSPDGQFIVGWLGRDLVLYGIENEVSSILLENVRYDYVSWSEDSGSLFLVDSAFVGRERSVYRLDIEDRSLSKIAQIGKERNAWGTAGRWVGVKPDGTPVLLRDQSIHNIYALEWNSD